MTTKYHIFLFPEWNLKQKKTIWVLGCNIPIWLSTPIIVCKLLYTLLGAADHIFLLATRMRRVY
jgi:hypothetical protein